MDPRIARVRNLTRRHFFRESQAGLGAIALASLLSKDAPAGDVATPPSVVNPLAPRKPMFAAKAKRGIYLHLTGSPPHPDPVDHKPPLVKHNAGPRPASFLKGKPVPCTPRVPH